MAVAVAAPPNSLIAAWRAAVSRSALFDDIIHPLPGKMDTYPLSSYAPAALLSARNSALTVVQSYVPPRAAGLSPMQRSCATVAWGGTARSANTNARRGITVIFSLTLPSIIIPC